MIWNNRGGSGKTNLTYHLAIKYAYRNPDKTVLVVDMCPQADLSHAFLGKTKRESANISLRAKTILSKIELVFIEKENTNTSSRFCFVLFR